MATWQVEFAVTNLAEKRVRVTGVRTDGEDVRSFAADGQIDAEAVTQSLQKIMDTIFAAYEAEAAVAAAEAALTAGRAAAAEAYLNGLET